MKSAEMPLSMVPIGEKANVVFLSIGGSARRRMLDLGVIDGTEIEPLYKSPAGNPVAYLIRGTVIALRSDVSDNIIVAI